MKSILEKIGLASPGETTFFRLAVAGYDPDFFVPVVPVLEAAQPAGSLRWLLGEAPSLWDILSLHKAVLESREYRDANGVEYEQFEDGGDVYVFNRVFPGSLQLFTPLGEEINYKPCGVCGVSPAAEMYHGPNLCAECAGVVIEKIKAEDGKRVGVHTAEAKRWCSEAGIFQKRCIPFADKIEDMPALLAKATGEFRVAEDSRSTVALVARRVERGLLDPKVAEAFLVEEDLPTTVPRRVLLPTVPVDNDFVTAEAIEEWFEDCQEEFGYRTREAMPHGVAYFGEDEVVVVAFDHLLSEEAKDLVVGAADAQRVLEGLIAPAEASTSFHSVLVPKERGPAFLEALGFSTETGSEERKRVRYLQAPSERFAPGSIKRAILADGTEITFGERLERPDDLMEKAWEEFDAAVSGKDPAEIEAGLVKHLDGGASGLGGAAEAALQKLDALADPAPENPADIKARLMTEKMKVQKLLFPVSKYSTEEAKAKAKKLGFSPQEAETRDEYVHVRVAKPKQGVVTRTFDFGKGIKAVGQRVADSQVRVYDDPADMGRLLREIALHNLVEGADKVAITGPRSWALGYPTGDASLLVYFPRHGIARVYAREDLAFRFEDEALSEQAIPNPPPDTEAENMDQMLDGIVRKLILSGSLDALQDVEFDEDTSSIYLFFSAGVQRDEIDEIMRDLSRQYAQTQLVASPDQSLPDEVGESDWWVVFVPGKDSEGAFGTPDPAKWGAANLPSTVPQGFSQYMDQDTAQSIAKGLSLDKAIDALTTEDLDGLKEVDFNPYTFALAFAGHFGLDEKAITSSPLAPGTVFLNVANESGVVKRLDFTQPGVGAGVNVVVTDAANGRKETVGNFKQPSIMGLLDRLGENPAWRA